MGTAQFLVGAAVHAPSLHNSQPWRFGYHRDGSLDLWADRTRQLPVLDPHGRELIISCGAALAGLRLAVRWLGYQSQVVPRPDPRRPALLARVRLGQPEHPSPATVDLFTAILDRYTHRGPFADTPLSPHLIDGLCRTAAAGIHIRFIDDPRTLKGVVTLTARAQAIQDAQPATRADLYRWLRGPHNERRDGIPLDALRLARVGEHNLSARHAPGLDGGWPVTGPEPATLVVGSDRDDVLHWLRTGESLHRLLLRAAGESVYASIHTQPIEVPAVRDRLARLTGVRYPQVLLQMGHANGISDTVRRPPAEVLVRA